MTLDLKPRKFTVEEYAKMGEAGVFAADERVELIEGEIIPVSPQTHRHASRIARLTTLLVRQFGESHEVRVQLPLTLGQDSEPEPDLALVRLEVADSSTRHPGEADLVFEISDTTLLFDRSAKASLYAKHQLPEYWILNLKNQKLEIRREPSANSEGAYGWDYSSLAILSPGQLASPLFASESGFPVSELLGVNSQ